MNMLSRWFTTLKRKDAKKALPEDAARVYSQLFALKTARHFAWCRFGRVESSYQSMILDMNVDDRTIILDEPFGLPSHFYWSPGMPVSVEIKGYQTCISFASRFIQLEPDGDNNRMVIAWPAEVDAHQRRSIFRVSFDESDHVPMIQFVDLAADLFPCLDLSFKGIGVAIPEQLGEQLYHGQELVIQLWLPDEEPFLGQFIIQRLNSIDDLGIMSIGGLISGVNSTTKRIIDRFLVAEQRKYINQKASGE